MFLKVVPVAILGLALSGCASQRTTGSATTPPPATPSAAGTASTPSTTSATTSTASSATTTAASSSAMGASTTLTGCLNKADAADSYMLTDEKTGAKTRVTGTAELQKHAAGHRVTLTGTRGSQDQFNATAVQHLAATCQAATP